MYKCTLSLLQNGLTPIHLAAQEDKVPVAEILVKYGSEVDSQTKVGGHNSGFTVGVRNQGVGAELYWSARLTDNGWLL